MLQLLSSEYFSSIISLLVIAVIAVTSYILSRIIGKSSSSIDVLVVFWFIWDASMHFVIEGSFLLLSWNGTVQTSEHWSAELWIEYGKADRRWLWFDPTIVCVEMATVLLCGPLCVLLVYAIATKQYYRHWLQIVVCVAELYGSWLTFGPEWVTGSPNLVTSNWLHLWIYLFFFNIMWVIAPVLLLYQSWIAMKLAFTPARSNYDLSTTKKIK